MVNMFNLGREWCHLEYKSLPSMSAAQDHVSRNWLCMMWGCQVCVAAWPGVRVLSCGWLDTGGTAGEELLHHQANSKFWVCHFHFLWYCLFSAFILIFKLYHWGFGFFCFVSEGEEARKELRNTGRYYFYSITCSYSGESWQCCWFKYFVVATA